MPFGFLLDTAGKAMPATLLLTQAATTPLLATQSFELAGTVTAALVEATVIGLLAAWVLFATFPATAVAVAVAPTARQAEPRTALVNTLVLLPVLLLFLLSERMTFVVLMVVIAAIRVRERSGAPRAALGLLLGNILGGLIATIVHGLVAVQPGGAFFLFVVLLVGLVVGARIATDAAQAPILTVAVVTFIILQGLGVSPLPTESGEAFTSRLWNVMLGGIYAAGATSLIAARTLQARAEA